MGCAVSDPLIDAEDKAATPLTPKEHDALIPTYVTLRRELNEVELIGIADADRWAFSRKRNVLERASRSPGRMLSKSLPIAIG